MAAQLKILVADDQELQQIMVRDLLTELSHEVTCVSSAEAALSFLKSASGAIDLVISDLNMGGASGIDLTRSIKAHFPSVDIIIITAAGTIEIAVEAIKAGASNFLTKPLSREQISSRLDAFVKKKKTSPLLEIHSEKAPLPSHSAGFIAESPAMKQIMMQLQKISRSDVTVLITGETGTGKEILARAIHEQSPRAKGPYVGVNCSAVPENLVESEFFGHEKGSFTGADKKNSGFFEKAENGTLFLDEIGELDIKLQPKLLRALEDRKIHRLGSATDTEVNVRLIAATHNDLAAKVASGEFREDLFYRLNVVHLHLPPLRDRKEDFPPLIRALVRRAAGNLKRAEPQFEPSFIAALTDLPFPGNVRELSNLIEKAVLYLEGDILTAESVPISPGHLPRPANAPLNSSQNQALGELMASYEKQLIERNISKNLGNLEITAKELGISRSTLYAKIAKYGIKS